MLYLLPQIMSKHRQQACFIYLFIYLNVVINLTGLVSVCERSVYVPKSDGRGQSNCTGKPPVQEGQPDLELVY